MATLPITPYGKRILESPHKQYKYYGAPEGHAEIIIFISRIRSLLSATVIGLQASIDICQKYIN